jgi:hypothetical protein
MERLSMRKIREVLRLRYAAGLSTRQVAASVQLAHSTVVKYARRFAAAGLSWSLPATLSDTELERRLFPPVRDTKGLARLLAGGQAAAEDSHLRLVMLGSGGTTGIQYPVGRVLYAVINIAPSGVRRALAGSRVARWSATA